MKAQSKNRKSPTCSRCRSHGERDVRVLQHKCPYKDCSCSDCLLVKKRPIVYRAQKNLDKQDENSNEVSSPGSGSTGSSRCLGSPQIPMHPGNMGDSNEPSLQNPWSTNHQQPPSQPPPPPSQQQQQLQPPVPPSSLVPPPQPHQMPPSSINAIPPNKNSGYSNIKNFHELCLTFPDHTPPQLQTLFEQCGNDYEKTIDKILMSKWYSESSASSNDYQSMTNDPNYLHNHNTTATAATNHNNNINSTNSTNNNNNNNNNSSNHNHNHHNTNHNNSNNNNNNHNNLEYPTNEDDTRLSFANCHYNQQQQQPQPQQQQQQQQQPPSQRLMTAPNFNNQDYTGDELVNRPIQPHSTDAMPPDWSYGDTTRYSTATSNYPTNNNSNTWNQGDYPTWSNASSNFWPSNGHTTYSYVDQNDGNMSYYYGRREMDYQDPSGHLDRTAVRPEIGPNISSNYDFDSY